MRLRVLAALRRRGHCAEGPSVATRCPEAPESSDPSSHLPTAMAGCTHLCSPSGKPWLPRLLLHGRPQPCAMPKPSLCAVSAAWAFSRGRGPGSAVLCPFPEAGAVLPAARPGWGGALSPAPGDLLDLQPSRVGRRLSLAAGIVLRSRVFISWVLVPPAPPTPVPHSKKKKFLSLVSLSPDLNYDCVSKALMIPRGAALPSDNQNLSDWEADPAGPPRPFWAWGRGCFVLVLKAWGKRIVLSS